MVEKILQNVICHDRPTMEQLIKIMRIEHIATKWHELGPVLVDSYSTIKEIESNHRNDVSTCCRIMFEKWLEMKPDASWSQLVTALNDIEMKTAADVISKELKPDVTVMSVSQAEDVNSENLVQLSTPHEASVEFGILLEKIVEELEKNETSNLRMLKTISSTLTIQENSKVRVFTDGQLEEIQACNSIHTLLVYKLRHCYRWDDLSMLNVLVSSIKSKKCLTLLKNFEIKTDANIKLQQIYKHYKHKAIKFPEEYHKIVAIIKNKIFSDITRAEYSELKHFTSKQCGVEAYVFSPVIEVNSSSLILGWYIPVTAIAHMIETALSNIGNFTEKGIVYLRISSTVILDHRDMDAMSDRRGHRKLCLYSNKCYKKRKYFPKKLIVSIPRSISLLRVSMAIPLHLLPIC